MKLSEKIRSEQKEKNIYDINNKLFRNYEQYIALSDSISIDGEILSPNKIIEYLEKSSSFNIENIPNGSLSAFKNAVANGDYSVFENVEGNLNKITGLLNFETVSDMQNFIKNHKN